MILVDHQIKVAIENEHLFIEPHDPGLINPNSLDVRLADRFRYYKGYERTVINPYNQHDISLGLTEKTGIYTLHPGSFVLGSTVEKISLPDNLCAELNGKSSVGRLGIDIHRTAGWIDAGFSGHITLELSNIGSRPVKLIPGMTIGQLVFHATEEPAEQPYNVRKSSKYMYQEGPVESRYYLNR